MKKHRANSGSAPAEPTPDTWNNPFIGLDIKLPDPPEPPPPPPPTKEELRQQKLSDEDLALLKEFSGGSITAVGKESAEPVNAARKNKGRLSFNIQRKGKGGKTVTNVRGLERLDIREQMELCSQAKSALGCGARFLEGVLEIQGDQRARAAQWLAKQGYDC